MNVLIADKLSDAAVGQLEAMGCAVKFLPDTSAEELPNIVGDSEIIIVRSTKVTEATIQAGNQLGLIIRAGAGVNTIDLNAASSRGIYVCNCPGQNTNAVAELAIGLMVAADRRIADATEALRNGNWKKKLFGKARGLKHRTLGILGTGTIGTAVIRSAQALEMDVVAWSRSLSDERAEQLGVRRMETPDQVASVSDVVSIHVAVGDQTRHLVNADWLSKLKPGAIVVNTSRGEIVDTQAMKNAIADNQIRYATDVFEGEPTSGEATFDDSDFAAQITCTPHIGASTDQAAEAIAIQSVRIVEAYQSGESPPGAVNLCAKSPATYSLVVRHFNQVGVLAQVLDGLRSENVNVEEMENIVFDGTKAACCTLRLDQQPSSELISSLRSADAILAVTLTPAS